MAEHDPDAAGATGAELGLLEGLTHEGMQNIYAALAGPQAGTRQGFHNALAGALAYLDGRAAAAALAEQQGGAAAAPEAAPAAGEQQRSGGAAQAAAQAYALQLTPLMVAPADVGLNESERAGLRRLLRASAESLAAAPPLPTDAADAAALLLRQHEDAAQWDALLLDLLAPLTMNAQDPGAPAMQRVHQLASMPELMPALLRWLAPLPPPPAGGDPPAAAAVFSAAAQRACLILAVMRLDIRSRRRLMTAGGPRLYHALLPLAAAASLPDTAPDPTFDTSPALRVLSTLLLEDHKCTAAKEGRKMYNLPPQEEPHLEWHERWNRAYRPLPASVRRAAIQQPGLLENAVRQLSTESAGVDAAALLASIIDGPQTARLFIQTSPDTVCALLPALRECVGPAPAASGARRGGGDGEAAAPAGHDGSPDADKKTRFLADCVSALASKPNTRAFTAAVPDAEEQLRRMLTVLRVRLRVEEGSERGYICPCCGDPSELSAAADAVHNAIAYLQGQGTKWQTAGEARAMATAQAMMRMLFGGIR